TVAGTRRSLEVLKRDFPRIPVVDLGLDYPFHTKWMDGIKEELLSDLRGIIPRKAVVRFVSSVNGSVVDGAELGGEYWWRNVREPVKFASAIRTAAELGARVYVEIGPRPSLIQHISDGFEASGARQAFALSVLHQEQRVEEEPFD